MSGATLPTIGCDPMAANFVRARCAECWEVIAAAIASGSASERNGTREMTYRPKRIISPRSARVAGIGRGLAAACFLGLMIWQYGTAQASISFDGFNRFVMDGQTSRKRVDIVNDGTEPALVQVSIEWGEPEAGKDLPLVVSSPLVLIPGNQRKSVQILYQGTGLPTDRESYFLLSVLEIPQRPSLPNTLQIALRHNLKFFFRPPLDIGVPEAVGKLEWLAVRDGSAVQTKVRNDSPYYLTLTDVRIEDSSGNHCGDVTGHLMLAPFSLRPVEGHACAGLPVRVDFQYVSDGGLTHPRTSGLKFAD
ncbi:fimbrial biogenesis chaperone [Burkholderia sp. F1]|uniref:fimbrial biogenesis chaperone n=1 Tax=Burkholderia sp. F1 TaxID=3366817 RepID=UPI003D742B0E